MLTEKSVSQQWSSVRETIAKQTEGQSLAIDFSNVEFLGDLEEWGQKPDQGGFKKVRESRSWRQLNKQLF